MAIVIDGLGARLGLGWVAFVVAVVAVAVGYAFRLPPAGPAWLVVGVPYALLAVMSLVRLGRTGRLSGLFAFRRGDPTLGILLGLAQIGAAWAVAKVLLPSDSPQRAWLMRVFLVLGDSSEIALSVLLVFLVVCEEIVWRGLVQAELREAVGARRAWMVAALLYAAAHLPTLVTLRDPAAGYNPLLLLAALGCGLCWGFLAEKTGRLIPSVFAHGVFTYFSAQSFWLFV